MVKIQTWWERRETRTRTGEDRTATGSKPNGAPALRRLLVSAKGRHRRPYSERKRSFEMPETFARGTPGIFCMGNHLRHPPTPLVESTCRLEDDATGRSLLSTLSIARQLVDAILGMAVTPSIGTAGSIGLLARCHSLQQDNRRGRVARRRPTRSTGGVAMLRNQVARGRIHMPPAQRLVVRCHPTGSLRLSMCQDEGEQFISQVSLAVGYRASNRPGSSWTRRQRPPCLKDRGLFGLLHFPLRGDLFRSNHHDQFRPGCHRHRHLGRFGSERALSPTT